MATKDYSSKQEKMIADYLNWKVVSGSGAAPCVPGDVISPEWLGECKTHVNVNDYIEFKASWWTKIVKESTVRRRKPVLFTDNGTQEISKTWAMFRLQDHDDRYSDVINKLDLCKGKRINLKFDSIDVRRTYLSDVAKHAFKPLLYHVIINKVDDVCICPLSTFEELFSR